MARRVPLSSLPAFSGWDKARSWGPDDAWRVTLGGGDTVVADLLAPTFQ